MSLKQGDLVRPKPSGRVHRVSDIARVIEPRVGSTLVVELACGAEWKRSEVTDDFPQYATKCVRCFPEVAA